MTLEDIYNSLGIQQDELGCIMMDTESMDVQDILTEEDLYYAKEQDRFWINGIVSDMNCHVTLLFGLIQSGNDWKRYVDALLEDWSLLSVHIDNVSYFDSPYPDEPYYCLVAKLAISPELLDGNGRLRKLPHVDTFPDYTPHCTIAYIKKDAKLRDELLYALNNRFAGKDIKTVGINYGR